METWRSIARKMETDESIQTDVSIPLSRFHFLEDGEIVVKFARDLFHEKRVVIFGVPGAFTPTCSNSQVPDFEAAYDDIIAAGVDEVYCISVNDPYVMNAWKQHLGVEKVKFIPDGNGFFTRQLGKNVFKSNVGFGVRSWRYAAVINSETAEIIMAEVDQQDNCTTDPYENSTPARVLAYLREVSRIDMREIRELDDRGSDLEELERLERNLILRKSQLKQITE